MSQEETIEIVEFQEKYLKQVSDLILDIQNNEFAVAITLDAQPDLLAINDFYIKPGGDFLIAILDNQVVGTIGTLKISETDYAIRKMFVHKDYRGSKYKVAQRLLDQLTILFKTRKVHKVYLGTIDKYQAAIRFYTKNGFIQIDQSKLPEYFPRMKVDNVFFEKVI